MVYGSVRSYPGCPLYETKRPSLKVLKILIIGPADNAGPLYIIWSTFQTAEQIEMRFFFLKNLTSAS